MVDQARARVMEMDFWQGEVSVQVMPGGLSNHSFLVEDDGQKYAVRIGDDRPEHAVYRYNEIAVSQAAYEAGLSPALVHHEPGAMVFEYLAGSNVIDAAGLEQTVNMDRLIGTLGQCHLDLSGHLEAPGPMFWVFHLNRRYARIIMQHGGAVGSAFGATGTPVLGRLMAMNDELETAIGAITPVFCHNDLVAENILDDGQRFWLIDWEYGGWNDGLYDLACLAAHLDLGAEMADEMLHRYLTLNGEKIGQAERRRFAAWKCAALIWAALWGGVGGMFANLDFDYAAYSRERLDHLERASAAFREL